MKLIPKAKPVKIRIKSGGEEHSSLDSLKRNFDISNIQPLLDGRLVRWLKQQGENELANVISEVDSDSLNTLQGVMNVMQIFFKDYIEANAIHNSLELTKHWLSSSSYRKNGEYLFYEISLLWDDPASLETIKYLYKHREELNVPKCDWYLTFDMRINNEVEDKTDPEVLYIVGKMLWEGYQFNDLYLEEPYRHYEGDPDGLEMIEKSARLGCQEANLFIFEYNRKQKEKAQQAQAASQIILEDIQLSSAFGTKTTADTNRFGGVDKDKIRNWIRHNWGGWHVGTLNFSKDGYSNDKERSILIFLSTAHYLGYISERLGFGKTLEQANSLYAVKANDILRSEKMFITGLLYVWIGYKAQANEIFVQIKDYKLANYMLGNTRIIDQLNFKSMSFRNQLSFIKDHLFDYE